MPVVAAAVTMEVECNMKPIKIALNQNGNSMVMIIIVSAVISGLGLTIAGQSKVARQTAQSTSSRGDLDLLHQELNAIFNSTSACSAFARGENRAPVVIGKQEPEGFEVKVKEIFQGNQPLFAVGSRVSPGVTVSDIRLVATEPSSENIKETDVNIGGVIDKFSARSMSLQVKYQRSDQSIGAPVIVKDYQLKVYFPKDGGALASCENEAALAKKAEQDPGQFSIKDATGKVDWVKQTQWASGSGKAKYLGITQWYCQNETGTGECDKFDNNNKTQNGITVNCKDGRAGVTVLRSTTRSGQQMIENFTTYCAFDPNKVTIADPPPPVALDASLFIDGDLVAMCKVNPNSPRCASLVEYAEDLGDCRKKLPDELDFERCISKVDSPSDGRFPRPRPGAVAAVNPTPPPVVVNTPPVVVNTPPVVVNTPPVVVDTPPVVVDTPPVVVDTPPVDTGGEVGGTTGGSGFTADADTVSK
jgi:hypothetical protein